ncbi:MAG: YicC family protein, partial [Candidatus Electrothrix sp. AR3]|nr:YicC family protein [Candidatus Electrothrix sp. AR3]
MKNMRPRSMTGFGRGKSNDTEQSWIVEIRTVNHRFLDQRIVLPPAFAPLEERIKKTVAGQQDRGKVDTYISYRGGNAVGASQPVVDIALAQQYHRCLLQLQQDLGLVEAPVQLHDLLAQRGIIAMQEQNPNLDQEW